MSFKNTLITQLVLILSLGFQSAWATDAEVTYYHNDLLGSPVAATDEAGEVIWREDYNPFGEKREAPLEGENDVGYTGHQSDDDLGLVYMQARYYDPAIGRFYSNDPVGFREGSLQSFNRYAYGNNNSYRYVDPDGNIPVETVWDVANVGIGVVSFSANVAVGNYWGAALDAVGVIVDGAATVVPYVPGGAGTAIKGLRASQKLKGATKSVDKADTLKPGPFAKESIPARGPERNFTKAERDQINKIGNESGCHTCGTKEAGTKSGNYIPDHQPANALNKTGGPQRLYPHCKSCSARQAGQVTQAKRKLNQ